MLKEYDLMSFNKLPSRSSKIFNENSEDLDLINNIIYSDCLYKERLNKDESVNILYEQDLNNLTLILLHTECFLNNYEDVSLETLLNYYSYLGVSKIILVLKRKDLFIIDKFNDVFKTVTVILDDDSSKSELINDAVKKVDTEYILICDDNSFISKNIFYKSIILLFGKYDFVYPSDRSYFKINELNNFFVNYDVNELCTDKRQYFIHDYNYFFCRKSSLKKIGCFNPKLKNEKIISNELTLRINYSKFLVKRIREPLYIFGYVEYEDNSRDESILIKQMNLSKLDDSNILLNHCREMFYFAHENLHKNDYVYPNEYLVSVIIPVYNCESFYLDRCIASLQNQSIGFENIEIILIDDNSTIKKSRDMLTQYSESFENIKSYFLEKNEGSGIARNAGISYATSNYILFLDHDDYYHRNYCEHAYDSLSNNDIDIFMADYVNLSVNYLSSNLKNIKLSDGESFLESFRDDLNVLYADPAIWRKGYRKDFLLENNLKFPEYRTAQDNLFNLNTLFKAEGIHVKKIISTIYKLRDNEDTRYKSISLNITKESLIEKINAYRERFKLFETYVPDETSRKYVIMNYWFEELFMSQLNYEDFLEVIIEAKEIFERIFDEKNNPITKTHYEFIESIIAGDYDKTYSLYLKNKTNM